MSARRFLLRRFPPGGRFLPPVYHRKQTDKRKLPRMETLRTVAKKKGLACLLHEKPFEGINGSGKHNNYSLTADDGTNLLKPGADPGENDLFLVTLCAFLQGVDDHADLLRMKLMSIALRPLCEPPFPLERIREMTALMGGDGTLD